MPSNTHSQSTAILILGMHRSGTSAVTRVVNLLGADLGSHFLSPADDNPAGFWEHLSAYEIHERLLTALGRNWYDMTEMPKGWLEHPAAIRAQCEVEDLIRAEFLGSPLWAVKDPRMCRLAPLWLRATANLGIKATALIVVREPREVAESLRSRDGWLHGHSYVMWVQHLLEAEAATRSIRRTLVTYESLMRDWRSCMLGAADQLGIKWPADSATIASQIAAYIDPTQLRHHLAAELESEPGIPAPPRLVTELYRRAHDIQASGAHWDSLQDGERRYEEARDMFALAIAEQAAKVAEYVADIQIWRAEAEACGARLKDTISHNHELQSAIDQSQGRVSQLTDWATALDSQVTRLQENERRLQQDLSKQELIVQQSEHARKALSLRAEVLARDNSQIKIAFELLKTQSRSRKWLLKRLLSLEKS